MTREELPTRGGIEVEELERRLASLRGSRDRAVYLLFTSTRVAAAGGGGDGDARRWCEDCEAADPVIDEAWSAAAPASALLIEIPIERARWKETPGRDHPFRREPFRVRGVPSIVAYDAVRGVPTRWITDCEQLEVLHTLFSRSPESS